MFASKGIAEHLVRGIIGISALAGAASLMATSHSWLGLAALTVALVALRGCPTCWLLGLVQTVVASARGQPSDHFCRDGTCALQKPPNPSSLPP